MASKQAREKAERLMLKQTLESNPKLKEIIDNMIDNPNPTLKDAIQPELERALKKARMDGILIGWSAFALRAIENIKKMNSVEEILRYFEQESDKTRDKLKLPKEEAE